MAIVQSGEVSQVQSCGMSLAKTNRNQTVSFLKLPDLLQQSFSLCLFSKWPQFLVLFYLFSSLLPSASVLCVLAWVFVEGFGLVLVCWGWC